MSNSTTKVWASIQSVVVGQMQQLFTITPQALITHLSLKIWSILLIQEDNIWMELRMLQEHIILGSLLPKKKIPSPEFFWGILILKEWDGLKED
jgi:hypothetical protein